MFEFFIEFFKIIVIVLSSGNAEDLENANSVRYRRHDFLTWRPITVFQKDVADEGEVIEYENKIVPFQSLCPTLKKRVFPGENDPDHQYKPEFYYEYRCAYARSESKNRVCEANGFSCIQGYDTIYLAKARKRENENWGPDCWHFEERLIMSKCDCMWNKSTFGDIADYH